jgi:hypothetical protein
MSKNQNLGDADKLTQNQNNAMSEDPKDGNRNSFKPGGAGGGPTAAPDEQGPDRLRELGRRGAKHNDD